MTADEKRQEVVNLLLDSVIRIFFLVRDNHGQHVVIVVVSSANLIGIFSFENCLLPKLA